MAIKKIKRKTFDGQGNLLNEDELEVQVPDEQVDYQQTVLDIINQNWNPQQVEDILKKTIKRLNEQGMLP